MVACKYVYLENIFIDVMLSIFIEMCVSIINCSLVSKILYLVIDMKKQMLTYYLSSSIESVVKMSASQSGF